MSNVMKTRCPHCETYGSHEVEKTETSWYYMSFCEDRLVETYGRGMLYRLRHRCCHNCSRAFTTNEIAGRDFDNIMHLWKTDAASLEKAETLLDQERTQKNRLLRHYDALLKSRGKGQLNSMFQSVSMLAFDSEMLLAAKRLKDHGIELIGHLLFYTKSELVRKGILTPAEWDRIAGIFAEAGITLEDDYETLSSVEKAVIELKLSA